MIDEDPKYNGVTSYEDLTELLDLEETNRYVMHCSCIMWIGHMLGLVQSDLPRLTAKGFRVLKKVFRSGWRPDWRVTAMFLATDYGGGADAETALSLVRKLNKLRP